MTFARVDLAESECRHTAAEWCEAAGEHLFGGDTGDWPYETSADDIYGLPTNGPAGDAQIMRDGEHWASQYGSEEPWHLFIHPWQAVFWATEAGELDPTRYPTDYVIHGEDAFEDVLR